MKYHSRANIVFIATRTHYEKEYNRSIEPTKTNVTSLRWLLVSTKFSIRSFSRSLGPFLAWKCSFNLLDSKVTHSCIPHFENLISYREETEADWYRGRLVTVKLSGHCVLTCNSIRREICRLFIKTECTSLYTLVIQ